MVDLVLGAVRHSKEKAREIENPLIWFDEFFNLIPAFSYFYFRPIKLNNLRNALSDSGNRRWSQKFGQCVKL